MAINTILRNREVTISDETIARFWAKVERGDVFECWFWAAARGRGGHGAFRLFNTAEKAHRIAWVVTFGQIPAGMYVCHHCDAPECCNPWHLFLGTHVDNVRDMWSKGRGYLGSRRPLVQHIGVRGTRAWRYPKSRHQVKPTRTIRITDAISQRFWSYVDRRSEDECWLWTKSLNSDRYGHTCACGVLIGAHRLAWMLTYGPIAGGLSVLHSCDVPACVNPNHLRLGTQRQNVADREARGRNGAALRRGTLNGSAKLTDVLVVHIRELARDGVSLHALARSFGVTRSTVQSVVRRQTWNHLPSS